MLGWQTGPLALAGTTFEITIVLGYLVAMTRVRLDGRPWPAWRAWCFVAGSAVIAVSLQSGFARYDDIVWVHVLQHQALMCVAAALLCLGAPVVLVLRVVSSTAGRRIVGLLHCRWLDWMNRPAAAVHLPAHYLGVMYVYLLTPLYALSAHNAALHAAAHAYFLGCGLMFWAPVLGQLPSRWRPAHRTKQLMVAVGLPANLLLALLIVIVGEPDASSHDVVVAAAVLAVSGLVTTVFGLALLRRLLHHTRPRRRMARVAVVRRLNAAPRAGTIAVGSGPVRSLPVGIRRA